jgi:hypothetical protein
VNPSVLASAIWFVRCAPSCIFNNFLGSFGIPGLSPIFIPWGSQQPGHPILFGNFTDLRRGPRDERSFLIR